LAVVAVSCALGLVLQCALLLYSSFRDSDEETNTVLALTLLLIVELVPGAVLVFTLRQPHLPVGIALMYLFADAVTAAVCTSVVNWVVRQY
jgi:hypothetical protein